MSQKPKIVIVIVIVMTTTRHLVHQGHDVERITGSRTDIGIQHSISTLRHRRLYTRSRGGWCGIRTSIGKDTHSGLRTIHTLSELGVGRVDGCWGLVTNTAILRWDVVWSGVGAGLG